MDPLSHVALGRTLLGLTHGERSGRGLIGSVVLGSLSPDVDALLMPFGWDLYLRAHEMGTHTIGGAFACGLLTASIVRRFAGATSLASLSAAACLGALSHVSLDLLSSARLRAFWPLVDRQISIPLVAMADPWLAGLLGTGAVALWWRLRPRPTAALTLALVILFLFAKGLFMREALGAYDAARDGATPVATRVVEAKWASIREWHVMDRTRDYLRVWRARADSPRATLILAWPSRTETKIEAASRSLPAVRHFLRVHQLGFAVTIPQSAGRSWVLWSDIRYCWNPAGEGAPQLEPMVVEGSQRLACALWFGGEFDAEGRPVRQIVKVFGFTQTRSLAR